MIPPSKVLGTLVGVNVCVVAIVLQKEDVTVRATVKLLDPMTAVPTKRCVGENKFELLFSIEFGSPKFHK